MAPVRALTDYKFRSRISFHSFLHRTIFQHSQTVAHRLRHFSAGHVVNDSACAPPPHRSQRDITFNPYTRNDCIAKTDSADAASRLVCIEHPAINPLITVRAASRPSGRGGSSSIFTQIPKSRSANRIPPLTSLESVLSYLQCPSHLYCYLTRCCRSVCLPRSHFEVHSHQGANISDQRLYPQNELMGTLSI
ncbi:uncharacterized protein EI90DRAFT_1187473 [Cantharellus anzutake]|uniref:uncharacterized protein n=1 Tax=Cantharellus anzutake TaxID=1750568 RepID=UPI001904AC4E|nr:uncharacterized protein EI90DRAFT_1187473 [Cantharellus anzutake]KAF8330399.1 hypothetical protein EI90DRAFT_1187473 [Cantharellus anzutake]